MTDFGLGPRVQSALDSVWCIQPLPRPRASPPPVHDTWHLLPPPRPSCLALTAFSPSSVFRGWCLGLRV